MRDVLLLAAITVGAAILLIWGLGLSSQLQEKNGQIDALTTQVQTLQGEIRELKKHIVAVELYCAMHPYKDTRWHSNMTFRLVNACPIPFTIGWIRFDLINATYIDSTYENWQLSANLTANVLLQPGGATDGVLTEELGYDKEPAVIGAQVAVFIPDIDDTLTFSVKFQPSPG
jgi:outer membrane murein-binding lipoprotein Lpp